MLTQHSNLQASTTCSCVYVTVINMFWSTAFPHLCNFFAMKLMLFDQNKQCSRLTEGYILANLLGSYSIAQQAYRIRSPVSFEGTGLGLEEWFFDSSTKTRTWKNTKKTKLSFHYWSYFVIYIHHMLVVCTCMSCACSHKNCQNCIFSLTSQKNRFSVTDMGLLKEVEKISASGVTLQFWKQWIPTYCKYNIYWYFDPSIGI